MLGKKNAANEGVGGTDGFHDADFGAALQNDSRGSGSNGERGGEKSGERDDPKQGADVRENFAFAIGDAANGADVGAGENLADLVADRRNVGRAEPAVIFGGSERLGIALGERIGWLGEGADKKLAKFSAVVAVKRLGDGKRGEDGAVFGITRGDDAGDAESEDACRSNLQ